MQNKRFNLSISTAALFALTVLFIPVGDAFAQTQVPLFDDMIVASVEIGGEVKVAPEAWQAELEAEYGVPASTGTLGALISTLDDASTGATIRFEGSYAAGDAVASLEAKGYVVTTATSSPLPSADGANVMSD